MSETCKKLKILPLAFALGITWGLGILFASWLGWWIEGYAAGFIRTFASIYVGYHASFWGGIIGFMWGFIDLFIGGLILGWIYNGCAGRCALGKSRHGA